jgi:hypothetical protein
VPRRTAVLAFLFALLAPAAARAETVTQTADAGPTHAELSFDRTGPADSPEYSNMVVRISEAGVETVTDEIGDGFAPGGFDNRPSVTAVDLDRDGTAEVVVDVYTGGAHCCLQSFVYDGRQRHNRDWRDAGYELVRRGGRYWFRSADDAFAYAYGAYAYSRLPLQILSYTGTGFENVTRAVAWREDLRVEAAALLREYRRARRHLGRVGDQQLVRATLAAYAADQGGLGDCARGITRIKRAVRRGEIRRYGKPGTRPGRAFLHDVRRDLRRGRYLR